MPSQAARRLQHMRKRHEFTQAHVRKLIDSGLGKRIVEVIPSWTGFANPGIAVEMVEAHQRAIVLSHIAEVVAAFPEAVFPHIDFQFVRTGTPNAFATHVAKDDSYAIGLDHGVMNLLHVLFVAAMAAHQVHDFNIFGVSAARMVGLFFLGKPADDLEDDVELLHGLYTRSSDSTRSIIDGFAETAVRFVIAHELGHVALSHFRQGRASSFQMHPGGMADISAFDHEREYEADAWAAAALLKIAHNDVRRLTLAGAVPFLCFTIMAFVSRLHEPATELGRLLRSSHPSDELRATRLREFASRRACQVPVTNALDLLVKIDRFLRAETTRKT